MAEPFDKIDGAAPFVLLCHLGLAEYHKVLDFGCRNLNLGRLLISFLQPGCYFGIEPDANLVEGGIDHHLGSQLVKLKRPIFSSVFLHSEVSQQFDFILAQSFFNHSDTAATKRVLASFSRCLAPNGLCVIAYSGCAIHELTRPHGLVAAEIHPRKTWWLLAAHEAALPSKSDRESLSELMLHEFRVRGAPQKSALN